jgi:formamidopyrimidine-DNA glycosylase
MPELPEVETTRRGIAPWVERRRIVAVYVYDHRLRWPVPAGIGQRLAGRTVDHVERRGKYLLFRLDGETLLVHLGMTGTLRVHPGTPPARRPHDHVDLRLDDGTTLRYHDPRRFGAILLLDDPAEAHPLLRGLGPEPLSPAFDAETLHAATRRRSAPIKSVLMDNHVVVGVGNIYANESLYRAGIRPGRAASGLSRPRLARLIEEVRATLVEAIAAGGSTLRDYVGSTGEPGYFQLAYFVYGRAGEPCRRCASAIRMRRIGGRASFYCPRCQS